MCRQSVRYYRFFENKSITIQAPGETERVVITQCGYQYRTEPVLPTTINRDPKRRVLSTPYAIATLPVTENSLTLGVQAAELCSDLVTIAIRKQHPQLVIRADGDSDCMHTEIPTNMSAVVRESPLEVTYPTDVIANIYSGIRAVVRRLHLRLDTDGNLCITAGSPAGLVTFRFIIPPYELVVSGQE